MTYQEKVENIGILDFSCLFVCLSIFEGLEFFPELPQSVKKIPSVWANQHSVIFYVSDKVVHNLI